jgi:predicted nucleotide-binding protein (sugar kinase/HSP70/actin superfamily)
VLVFVFTDEITASLRHISQGQQENRETIVERFDEAEASQQDVLQNQQTMHQTLTRIEGIILEGRAGTLGTSL